MPNTIRKSSTIQTRTARGVANVVPGSWNEEDSTLEIEFASEKPVLRFSYENYELYSEILEMSESAAGLARLIGGGPVLKDHRNSVESTVGVSLKAWVEDKKARAIIKLADDDDNATFRSRVAKGIIRQISFGYRVNQYTRTKKNEKDKGEIAIYRATEWEALEISFVGIPADETVKPRSLSELKEEELKLRNSTNLHTTTVIRMEEEIEEVVADAPTPEPKKRAIQKEQQVDTKAISEEAAKAERLRASSIKQLVRTAKLGDDFAEKLIDDAVTIDKARELVIAKWAETDPLENTRNQNTGKVTSDEADKKRQVMAAGLALRSGEVNIEKMDKTLVSEANQYRRWKLQDVARTILEEHGVRTMGLDSEEIAKLVFQNQSGERSISQSSSDFTNLLGGVIHQILLAPYAPIADTWRSFCSVGSVSDFRPNRFLRPYGLTNLDEVAEDEEYKNKPLTDATGESIRVKKWGNIVNLSWEMVVNDELDAFASVVSNLNRAAERTIEARVYARLAENSNQGPTMEDGNALFHASHNNLITAAAMSGTSLDGLRYAMAIQQDPGALDYLDLRPSVLLVNSSTETTAKIYNNAQYDTDVSSKFQVPSRSYGLFEKIVASPRFQPATGYIAWADPNVEPVLRVVFMNGQQTPVVERHDAFRQDGAEWKIRTVFEVGAVGWRGAVLNKGA